MEGTNMKIVVTGGSGFLGKKVSKTLSEDHEVVGTYSKNKIEGGIKLNLTKFDEVQDKLKDINPDVIIHTAAMTDIDACEKDKFKAWLTNTAASFHLATICEDMNIRLIYISTDYVFSGKNSPYYEKDIPHPINFYGETKLMAEKMIKRVLNNYVIIRIPILYGYNDESDKDTFVSSVVKRLRNKSKVYADNIRIKYPVLIDDVAKGIKRLLHMDLSGVVHFSHTEGITRYKWALKIAHVFELPEDYIEIRNERFGNGRPERPYCVELLNTRLKDLHFHSVMDGLKIMKDQMEKEI